MGEHLSSWANGKNVVVLGAGATRGAEFVGQIDSSECLPPLNADFFTQLQRVSSPKHQQVIDEVIEDVKKLFGANFKVTLEEYFSLLQALIEGRKTFLKGRGRTLQITWLQSAKTRLINALAAVLEESADVTRASSGARNKPCKYHADLVAALKPPDTLISFNYDCVIDFALRESHRGVWSAEYGYGFSPVSKIDEKSARIWSSANAPTRQNETIRLLKLHGSLNWKPLPSTEEEKIFFRQMTYKQKGQKLFHIIPPESIKNIDDAPMDKLWEKAASAVRSAQTLTIIGFSFPQTDQAVEALFRISLAESISLKKLIIVNPSEEDRYRIRQVCAPALARNKVRLVQFSTFSEFSRVAKTHLAT